MELHIDTSQNEFGLVSLHEKGLLVIESKFEARFKQSEKLLVEIERMLKKARVDKKELKKILVSDQGEGFSSLRIGVVTANALAYGLGIEVWSKDVKNIKTRSFTMVEPRYLEEPNIG